MDNIRVFIRCRPLNANEKLSVDVQPENNSVQVGGPNELKVYHFNQVFGPDSDQSEIYQSVVQPMIDQITQGYNCTVFAYGQTGTGKTYTMEGERSDNTDFDNDPHSGIIPRAINQLFDLMTEENELSLSVSFLELYNEEAYDLFTPIEDTTKLKIFDDASRKGSVIVENLTEVNLRSKDEVYGLLRQGSAKRRSAATLLNTRSSRSHTIFTITSALRRGDMIRHGKLNMVDLAGSENISRSGAQDKFAREAGNINQSLLTLGRVISALVEKRSHIPYRESRLTRLLQDSLGGSAQTSIIVTISPADSDLANTVSALEYASRARCIINRPEVKKELPIEFQRLIEKHAAELCEVEFRVRNEVALEFRRESEKIRATCQDQYAREIDNLKNDIKSLNNEISELEKKLKVANELAQVRAELAADFENKLREAQSTIKELSAREPVVAEPPAKKRIRQRIALQEEEEYANMTFEAGDELQQVETSRKKIAPGVKRRQLDATITLSGKKKKLAPQDEIADLSPEENKPVGRVTRSRAQTKRKLNFAP